MTDRRLYPGFPPEVADAYRRAGHWGDSTIGEELRAVARQYPDLEAVVDPSRRVTYAELDRSTDAIAAQVLEIGLKPGDPVLLQVGNSVAAVEALYGLVKAGVVPVCSLVPFGHHELDAIGVLVGARGHLVQADLPNRDLVSLAVEVREVVPTMEFLLTLGAGAAGGHRLDDPAARPVAGPPVAAGDPDGIAMLQLSGGTTGTPKAIPRLHAEYWYNGRATAERYGMRASSRVGHFMPFVHNAGIHSAVFAAHSVGATLVLGPTWNNDLVIDTLPRERVTHLATMTSLAQAISDDPRFPAAAAGLERFAIALPAVPEELFDKLTAMGLPVAQFFGMSEGLVCSAESDAVEAMRRGTVGYPLSVDDEVRILDPDGEAEVPDGEVGELAARGPYTIRGYYNAAEHNRVAFTADGFYRTGDLAQVVVIDGHRCLRIAGRKKDLISRGGEKINAEEIEWLLAKLPGVQAAALVGMPDARLGERACAFLVTDGRDVSLEEVRAFLADRGVARYKWPERIERVDELPRTPVGKIAKVRLREMLAQPAGGTTT